MKSCSILISSWCGHKAIELCIESILKRTNYKAYQIIVCDSSSPYGPDRKYLTNHKEKGNIELLESDVRLQHGQALWRLLSYCKTDLACILDSDSEILSSDWLEKFTSQIQDYEKDFVSRWPKKHPTPTGHDREHSNDSPDKRHAFFAYTSALLNEWTTHATPRLIKIEFILYLTESYHLVFTN